MNIPLFPLNTVLFPGGLLPLRIFEPRYVDMVRECMREETGFGVVQIRAGQETGQAAEPEPIGTLARITDWDQSPDGLLAITALGEQRFRTLSRAVQKNQLTLAEVELLPAEPEHPMPADLGFLSELTEQIINQLGEPWRELSCQFDEARWVGYRLAELLPFSNQDKQTMLAMHDPLGRVRLLAELVKPKEQ